MCREVKALQPPEWAGLGYDFDNVRWPKASSAEHALLAACVFPPSSTPPHVPYRRPRS